MIQQFKISVKGLKPPVWRRLQVHSDITFDQLHTIIQVAFDWSDTYVQEFRMLRHNEEKMNVLIGSQEHDPFFMVPNMDFVQEEQILADWFVTEQDKALYTYYCDGVYELEILLEKIVPIETDTHYPRCIKAMRQSPSELDVHEQTALLNTKLSLVTTNVKNVATPAHFSFNWKQLLQEAHELYKLTPWTYLNDQQLFAIIDPDGENVLYCSVLGGAGEEYGLAVYIGTDGLHALQSTLSGDFDEDILMIQRSVLLSFADIKELDDQDMTFLRRYDSSYPKEKPYVQLRSMMPGYIPWEINEEEGRLLRLAIQQTKEMMNEIAGGLSIPSYQGEAEMIARVPQGATLQPTFKTVLLSLHESTKSFEVALQVSEIELQRVKRLSKSDMTVQFGYFMLPQPIQEEFNGRPFFPLIVLAIDEQQGMIVHQDVTRKEELQPTLQSVLLETFAQLQHIPAAITVTPDVAAMLSPVTEQFSIRVKSQPFLPGIEQVRTDMNRMPF